MAAFETLLVDEPQPGIALVTLHRPARHNPMTMTMFAERSRSGSRRDSPVPEPVRHLPRLDTLSIELLDEQVAVLRVDRPERMNSQTVAMFHEHGVAAARCTTCP